MRTEDGDEIITPDDYDLGDGKTLHVWITGDGTENAEMWACCAPDHGPFCRLCQPVDGTTNALLIAVIDGNLEIQQDADGGFLLKITKAGEHMVRNLMIDLDPGEEA